MLFLKPRIPQINWGHPFAKQLIFDIPFLEGIGTAARDIVNYKAPGKTTGGTFNGAGATWVTDFLGKALSTDASTGYMQVTNDAIFNTTKGAIMVVIRTTQTVSGNPAIIHSRVNSSQSNGGFSIMQNSSQFLNCQFKKTDAGVTCTLTGATAINDGRPHVIIVNYDTANGGTNTIYLDGKVDATGTNSAAWSWNSANVLRWGIAVDGFWNKWNGKNYCTRWWSRNLLHKEIQALSINPWALYKKPMIEDAGITLAAIAKVSGVSYASIVRIINQNIANAKSIGGVTA